MYMYVYVYMHMYMCLYIYIYMYVCIYIYMHMYMCLYSTYIIPDRRTSPCVCERLPESRYREFNLSIAYNSIPAHATLVQHQFECDRFLAQENMDSILLVDSLLVVTKMHFL